MDDTLTISESNSSHEDDNHNHNHNHNHNNDNKDQFIAIAPTNDQNQDHQVDSNPNPNPNPTYIFLKFINQKDETTHFKVRRTSKMRNAFQSYYRHHKLQFGTARFLINGDQVPHNLTPFDLNLKDGVEIEVYTEAEGGNGGPIV